MSKECNGKLYREVALKTKESPKDVKDMFEFFTMYTATVIRSGTLETVMAPGFGRFRAKISGIAKRTKRNASR